jgi:FkbM family methyltransferase
LRPARLDISLRNAARAEIAPEPEPEAPAAAEAAPSAAEPPPAAAARGGPLRLLLRPFRGLAWRARSFLLAPIEPQLNQIAHRTAVLEAIVAGTLDHRTAMIETIAGGLAHAQAQGRDQVAALDARLGALAARLEIAQREAVGEMWVSLAGRVDELELKIRPILAFGDDAYAVRLGDGYILAPRDQPILLSMLADATTGGLEPGTRKTIQAILGAGMKAADIGANIGLLSLAMGRAVGPTGKVWSFEPEDAYRSLLTRSLHLNGLAWVELHAEAVGMKRGTQTFNVSSIPGHSSLFALPAEEKPRKVKVQVVRLDDVVPAGTALDLVKIDVEGAELEVLAGMERVLAESPELAIVAEYGPSHLARVGIEPKDWFAAFEACGFEPFAVDEGQGRCYAAGPDELKDVESVNVVFVRRGGRAVRRLPR